MRKSGEFTKIGGLLKSGLFAIPAYQRDYSWELRNCETLAEDVFRIAETKEDHFLGSIVVMNLDGLFKGSSVQGDPENIDTGEEVQVFHVVDGQQRITSCSLFLCALRDELEEENDSEGFYAGNHPKSRQGIISSIDKCLFNDEALINDYYAPRLFLNNDSSVQYQCCLQRKKNNGQGRRVVNAYKKFRNIIRENRPQEIVGNGLSEYYSGIKNAITDSLKVDDICCDSFGSAFQIFESLNAKGMPLKSADLIKCFMMQKAESNITDGRTQWNKLLETVGASPDDSSKLDSFVNTFLFIKQGERVSRNHAYDTFKLLFSDKDYLDIYSELQKAADLYSELVNNAGSWGEDDPRRAFSLLKINSIYIPILGYALHNSLDVTDEKVLKLEKLLRPFAIRYKICGGSSNALDAPYKEMIKTINEGKDPEQIVECLKALKPSNDAFRTAFREMIVSDNEEPFATFLLEGIEHYLELQNESAKRLPEGYTLEHIIPKEYSKYIEEWEVVELPDSFSEEVVRSIGNLALIEGSDNSSANNNPYSTKVGVYKNGREKSATSPMQCFNLLRQVAEKYPTTFGIEEVRERSENMADYAVLIWE